MKRYTLRILLCIFLGIATTVSVAWYIAWRYEPAYWMNVGTSDNQIVTGWTHDESPSWFVLYHKGKGYLFILHRMVEVQVKDRLISSEELPVWSKASTRPEQDATHSPSTHFMEIAYGWPALSMRYEVVSVREGSIRIKSTSYLIPMKPGAEGSSKDTDWYGLPLRPTWPGFAINTLFYTIIFFFLIFGFSTTRCLIRKIHGNCIKCGYNLRNDYETGCPECGWNRNDSLCQDV